MPTLHPDAEKLISLAEGFFAENPRAQPREAPKHVLRPRNKYYDSFHALILGGLRDNESWVVTEDLDGPKYRRSRLCDPSQRTRYFSITTVYMESEGEYRGHYHLHPYGEINCAVQVNRTAELREISGWQEAGWTPPGPGTHDFPEAGPEIAQPPYV